MDEAVLLQIIPVTPPLSEESWFKSGADAWNVEPFSRVKLKEVALTTMDSMTEEEPETLRVTPLTERTALVVRVTSL